MQDHVRPPAHLGALVEERRRAAGLTQRELAERSGVSVGAIRDLEQGRTSWPRRDAAASLARVLGLRYPYLAGQRREGNGAPAGELTRGGSEPAGDVRVAVLGPLAVWRGGVLVDLGAERQRAVLALLALSAGRPVHRESIIDAIWSQAPPPSAVSMVQSYVSRLREVLGDRDRFGAGRGGLVLSAGESYLLRAGAGRLDVAEFGGLIARAREAVTAGDAAGGCELFDQAAGLWRGDPVADVALLRGHPAVTGLARQRAGVVLEYAAAAEVAGATWLERVLEQVRALAEREPLDERAHARLMIALAATGQQAAALQVFEQVRARLDQELGVRPGAELTEAHLRVLRGEAGGQAGRATGSDRATGPGGTTGPDGTREPGRARERGKGLGTPVSRGGAVLPRQLPSAVRHFAGRSGELKALWEVLDQAGDRPGAVVISAIGGMAGVGKTALAVHWAQKAADRFPDGQLFADLRGVGPSGEPADPARVIGWFLASLGVSATQIPADPQAQAALFRSVLAGKRVLIVLDNARDADQVRPLLPGSPGCLVLVTSRTRLTGLAAADGAAVLDLDVLDEPEAYELLASRLGQDRLAADPQAAADLVELCGRLPLALAITVARAAARPRFSLAVLADELRREADRLDVLDTGDPTSSVRQVFSWSCRQLSDPAARLFRLLGIHPGPDISVPAAASLTGASPGPTRRALAELTGAHLVTEPFRGRYALHDLLRAYAAEQAHDTEPDCHTALARTLDHYLHNAHTATLLLSPQREPVTLSPCRPGVIPEHLADHKQALAWYQAERQVLLAAVTRARENGFDTHAWQLPWAMTTFLDWQGHWHELADLQRTALAAVTRLGDQAGQAAVRRLLAHSCTRLVDYDQARAHLAECLDLYRQLDDRVGEARVHQSVSWVFNHQGRSAEALGHAEQALSLYRAIGHRAGQAATLNTVGWHHTLLGDHQQARTFCQQAVALHHELGARHGEATAWDSLGYAEHNLGHLTEAAACYQHAIGMFRELGNRYLEALTLTHLGDTRHAAGDRQQARDAWRQALAIYDDLDHPDADQVRARISG